MIERKGAGPTPALMIDSGNADPVESLSDRLGPAANMADERVVPRCTFRG
jgi:hypothetical protein